MRRIGLLAVLLAGIAAAVWLWSTGVLSWSTLAARQAELRAAATDAPVRTGALYLLAYAAVVALSIPGGVWMTIAGGLLFGAVWGSAMAVIGATIGACLLFLIARGALADWLGRKVGNLVERVRPGLERDGFSYLLAMRLLPVVPFWVTNLAPPLVGMRFAPYAVATFIGVIPATAVFASLGAGLGDAVASGKQPDLSVIFSPRVILPLFGLAALALTPVIWRRVHGRADAPGDAAAAPSADA